MADPTAQRIWNTALGQLQLRVTRPNYDTWLKNTEGVRIDAGAFVVGVPSEFIKEWLSTRMRNTRPKPTRGPSTSRPNSSRTNLSLQSPRAARTSSADATARLSFC